jgi:hypothetical protein
MKQRPVTYLSTIGVSVGLLICTDVMAMNHFEAVCSDVHVEGYRYNAFRDGKVRSEWSKDESFGNTPWHFRYTGGESAQVDDDEAVVFEENGSILILGTLAANTTASTMWFYLIHRDLQQIVASQVNGFTSMWSGVKALTIQLSCDFKELP